MNTTKKPVKFPTIKQWNWDAQRANIPFTSRNKVGVLNTQLMWILLLLRLLSILLIIKTLLKKTRWSEYHTGCYNGDEVITASGWIPYRDYLSHKHTANSILFTRGSTVYILVCVKQMTFARVDLVLFVGRNLQISFQVIQTLDLVGDLQK